MNILIRILSYYKKNKLLIFTGMAMLVISSLMTQIPQQIVRRLVDDVIIGGERDQFATLLITFGALELSRSVLMYVRSVIIEKAAQNALYDLRTAMYSHLQDMPFSFYVDNKIGELMSRMTGDLLGVWNFMIHGLSMLLENFLFFVPAAIIMFSMHAQLALFTLISMPIVAVTAVMYKKKIQPVFMDAREQMAALNSVTQENITGVRVVKAFAREDHEVDKFEIENAKTRDFNIKAGAIQALFHPPIILAVGISLVVVLWYGGSLVIKGEISLGDFMAFNGYMWLVIQPMLVLPNTINILSQAMTGGKRVFNILDTGSAIKDTIDSYKPDDYNGHVKFDDITFYFKDTLVLENVSIDVPAGNTLGILGATGSGKTALINLIGRHFDVYKGSVSVDGTNVKEWNRQALRQHMGTIMQETFLFSDSIENNILYGNPHASHEDVVNAAKFACAHDFIMETPDGYETVVGERGTGLSGGQRQRISIARALLSNPRILIMDDCTSALDMETEYIIQDGLKTLMKGKTTFIIAHRVSAVKEADEIILLKDNKIAERGTHKELLEKKGEYHKIFKQQYSDYEQVMKYIHEEEE